MIIVITANLSTMMRIIIITTVPIVIVLIIICTIVIIIIIMIIIMTIMVAQVLSNMNVAELVDFVKVGCMYKHHMCGFDENYNVEDDDDAQMVVQCGRAK